MKKILILAYDFPPYVSVGANRPSSWFQYFNEFGIYPIVITRQWDDAFGDERDYIAQSKSKLSETEEHSFGKIIKTPYNPNLSNKLYLKFGNKRFKIVRKLLSAYTEFAQFIFPIGQKRQIFLEAKKFLKTNKVDYILATGDPFILFKYAHDLGEEFNVPFILDYRDLWSQDIGMKTKIIFRKYSEYFEKKYLKKARQVITVSDYLASELKKLNKNVTITISQNGFDESLFQNVKIKSEKNSKLSIIYAGTIYPWHPISLFLECLNDFMLKNEVLISLTFVGVKDVDYLKEIVSKNVRVSSATTILPKISLKDLSKKLMEQDILLLFNDYAFMGTKIYDYLGANKKILFCFSEDKMAEVLRENYFPTQKNSGIKDTLQEDLIKKTNSGIIVKNSNELTTILNKFYFEWKENGSLNNASINTNKFSRRNQVGELAKNILNL